MMITIVGCGIAAVSVVAAAIDWIPRLRDWQQRIRIGRFTEPSKWQQCITSVASRWLNRTPKVAVTDNTRLIVLDMLKGNYSKAAIQHWQEASLLLGLADYLEHHENVRMRSEIDNYLSRKFDSRGGWRIKPAAVDSAILAYAVMKLPFLDTDRYKPAFDAVWELVQEHVGKDGTVRYRKHMDNYRYVDTIGFVCPFLTAYGIRYQQPACIELAVKQIAEYEKHGFQKELHIPCHAYHIDSKSPLGLYGWGRGLGWYALGLIDTWLELPEQHKYRALLEQKVIRFAKAVMSCQAGNGNWNWTVTRAESRPDSSATAALSWFLVNASRIEEIEASCSRSVDHALRYLMTVTRRNGAVDFSQGDTKDIGVYSMLFNILPFTQGLCIRTVNRRLIGENEERRSAV